MASLLANGLGVLVLLGWWLEKLAYLSLPPGSLHPFSGLSFILLGCSLWLQRREPGDSRARRLAQAFALSVAGIMVAVVVVYLVTGGARLNQALFGLPPEQANPANFVAPNAVVNFFMLGISLALVSSKSATLQRLAQALALVACIVAFLPLIGYLFRIAAFTRVLTTYLPMAPHTALGFLILGAGVLAARPERGFMEVLCDEGLGGQILRRLLPVLMLAPIGLGFIGVLSQQTWGIDPSSAIGLLVTGMVVVSASMLWWNSGTLAKVEAALIDSEEKLRTMIETSPDLILVRDLAGRYILVNPAFARMVGRPVAELIGKRDSEIFDPATAERIREHDRHVLTTEAQVTYEIAIHSPRGEDRIYESSKYPYYASGGELIGVIVIARDITERKRMEAQLRDQYEKLKELDKLKGDFVNAVSHDLRTPLTSILGYAEFLEDGVGGPLSDQQQTFVVQIEKSSKRLEGMVNDLLDFARLDAGTFRLHCEEEDLVGRVRELVDSMRPQAQDHHLELLTELPDEPIMRVLDPQRIDRVLANLIGNALKFTPEGGRVTVRLTEDDAGALCEVEDTGIGIAPEDLPKLFQRFTQLAAGARMKAGTGLGLSISKAQVEAHGGTVGVRSEPGKGSTFWFRLPRGVPAACRLDFPPPA
jgi:PAS domain S-box-containing protein